MCFQARRAAADAAAGAAETIARMRLEAAATISESADRLVKVLAVSQHRYTQEYQLASLTNTLLARHAIFPPQRTSGKKKRLHDEPKERLQGRLYISQPQRVNATLP